jgi:hypothetical protein
MNLRIFVFWTLVAAAGLASIGGAAGEHPRNANEQLREFRENIRRAHDSGDMNAYLANSRLLYSFLNGSPQSVLQLMRAQAAAGASDDALAGFEQFVRMGQSNEDALTAKQFDALRSMERYGVVHAAMAANNGRISTARKSFELDDASLVPEDIDFDAATQLFYITSVRKEMIIAVDMRGSSHVFANAPGGWPMLAIKIDARHRLLWATEVALDGFIFSPSKEWGKSAIDIYNLDTGGLLHHVAGPPNTALGDMALTPDGDAIVSDGEHGGVYRVERATQHIERLDRGGFISPQTPVVAPDGLRIIVPDYLRGIGSLDLKSKRITWLPMEGRYALNGIDGLYLSGNVLLAVQNGTSPERVIRFALDTSGTRIATESVIERASATLGDPTHGVVVGNRFYYIANSGWDALDEHGNLKAGKKMTSAVIMSAALQ